MAAFLVSITIRSETATKQSALDWDTVVHSGNARKRYACALHCVFAATAPCSRLPWPLPGMGWFLDSPARRIVTTPTEPPPHPLNTQRSPSWEADGSTTCHAFLWNLKDHYCVHTTWHWSLSWAKQIQFTALYRVFHIRCVKFHDVSMWVILSNNATSKDTPLRIF
jgi:hypothetical protein